MARDPTIHVGAMSGTSLDGVDVALVDLAAWPPRLLHAHTAAFPSGLREELLELCTPGRDHLDLLGRCDVRLGQAVAGAVLDGLRRAGVAAREVAAIGSHGQTVRHRPGGDAPFTLQIGDPNVIAERTGITTVADFRRRDLAAGGQAAPLVPAFHAALFAEPRARIAVANVGGIANVTLLGPEAVRGFDTGPGNVLLDVWAGRHLGTPFDAGGRFATGGRTHDALLEAMLADPYFDAPPPKSTGREAFNAAWLDRHLAGLPAPPDPADVQATLVELTARTLARGARHTGRPERVLVCGGGRRNTALMAKLGALMKGVPVLATEAVGVDGDWIEAMAFAWLARERLAARAGNVPEVTGASGPRVLGAVYPGAPDQNVT